VPPQTNEVADRVVRSLEKAMDVFGPDRVGPSLFRYLRMFADKQIQKRPFQNVVAKFLRNIRENRRFDLVSAWLPQVEELVTLHESVTNSKYEIENGAEHGSSKLEEVHKNKAFLYDVQRAIRPNKTMHQRKQWRRR